MDCEAQVELKNIGIHQEAHLRFYSKEREKAHLENFDDQRLLSEILSNFISFLFFIF